MDKMDLLLKEAFEVLAKEEYENRPDDIPKHRFSLRFRWNMHRLYRTLGKIKKHSDGEEETSILDLYRPLSARRYLALVSLLLLMLIGGTVFAGEPLIRWIHDYYMEQHKDHVAIQKSEKDEDKDNEDTANVTEFRKYRFQEVPVGYYIEKEEFSKNPQRYNVFYVNEVGNTLYLKQTFDGDEVVGNVTSNTEPLEEIMINGYVAYYAGDKDGGTVMFSDGTYMVVIYGNLPKETLIELAEGLELEP